MAAPPALYVGQIAQGVRQSELEIEDAVVACSEPYERVAGQGPCGTLDKELRAAGRVPFPQPIPVIFETVLREVMLGVEKLSRTETDAGIVDPFPVLGMPALEDRQVPLVAVEGEAQPMLEPVAGHLPVTAERLLNVGDLLALGGDPDFDFGCTKLSQFRDG